MVNDIQHIEQIVCNAFGVLLEDIYERNSTRRASSARHMLWLILHDIFGYSNLEVAKRYGRSRRKVVKYISEMRFRVENQREDINVFKDIKNAMGI